MFSQQTIERRDTLHTYDNGQLLLEHIKYAKNETITERIYFENGRLNYLNHLVNGQKNGRSFVYGETGNLVFEEYYAQNKLDSISKCFYPDGTLQRIEKWKLGKHVDTARYYSESGVVIKEIVFRAPCSFAGRECNKTIFIYEKGIKVYSYDVKKGRKSSKHIVFNQSLYDILKQAETAIPKLKKGESQFNINCAACHRLNKSSVGPGLMNAIKDISDGQVLDIILNSDTHSISKLSKAEFENLMEYLRAKE